MSKADPETAKRISIIESTLIVDGTLSLKEMLELAQLSWVKRYYIEKHFPRPGTLTKVLLRTFRFDKERTTVGQIQEAMAENGFFPANLYELLTLIAGCGDEIASWHSTTHIIALGSPYKRKSIVGYPRYTCHPPTDEGLGFSYRTMNCETDALYLGMRTIWPV